MRILLPAVGILAVWVGVYAATLPQVERPDLPELSQALTTLAEYGYSSEEIQGSFDYLHLLWGGVGMTATFVVWFYWLDWRERRRIWRVIEYAREINRRVYNLRPSENSEDELSLLSNELYKTTVLLTEAAERDRTRAEAMETTLADISHQLRTPLTSLAIAIDNLYDEPEMEEKTRQEFLRMAGRSVEQMSELTVTLLNLAKLDNGTLTMTPREVTAGELAARVVERLTILAEAAGVQVVVAGDIEASLMVDVRWQTEALTNIVKNCLEHSPAGSEVTIRVRASTVFTRLTITDHGEGIPADEVRHVFERFYRARNAAPGSVGIGLALARQLIEADNGQVRARSRLGVGTEFVVTYYKK